MGPNGVEARTLSELVGGVADRVFYNLKVRIVMSCRYSGADEILSRRDTGRGSENGENAFFFQPFPEIIGLFPIPDDYRNGRSFAFPSIQSQIIEKPFVSSSIAPEPLQPFGFVLYDLQLLLGQRLPGKAIGRR